MKMQTFCLLLALCFCITLAVASGRDGRNRPGRRRQKNDRGGPPRQSSRMTIPRSPWADGSDSWFFGSSSSSISSSDDDESFVLSVVENWNSDESIYDFTFGTLPVEITEDDDDEDDEEDDEESDDDLEYSLINALPWRGQGSFTGDLRLDCQNSACNKGVVQIFDREEGTWGTICADRWTSRESRVVCNYLQFRGARRAMRLKRLPPNSRDLPTMYQTLTCSGRETSLLECSTDQVSEDTPCESNRYAAVTCRGRIVESTEEVECTSPQVRCRNRQMCIDRESVCDGRSDCPWGSDEEDCEDSVSTSHCRVNQFWCGRGGGGCIRDSFRCDGDRDCMDGNDEDNCEDHLSHFVRTENSKLRMPSHRYDSGWMNASPYLCAEKCREHDSFRCVSFDYNKDLRECDLSEMTRNDVGLQRLSDESEWDHYEMTIPEDCSGFACGNICIDESQMCDGTADCVDGTDEADCPIDEENAPEIILRLTGGITPVEGRVEINRSGGNFGLVCDIGWSINEAHVACRQLGYRRGALRALSGLFFHRTNREYKMSGVSCTGNEESLDECDHDPWNMVDCPIDHEAGVICRINENHLSHFVRIESSKLRLQSRPYNGGFGPVSPILCAERCRKQNSFRCVSFDYNKELRQCFLSEVTRNDVGLQRLDAGSEWDHYEMPGVETPPTTTARPVATTTTTTIPTTTTTVATTTTSTSQLAPPASPACGGRESSDNRALARIVGGNNAVAHSWPWQAAIWLPWQLLCGGTLIDECWVLTAAHCFGRPFKLSYYTIRLGDHQTKANDGTEQDFKIAQIIKHAYNTQTHDNDIALIQLKRKNGSCALYNNAVQRACLPTSPTQFPAGTTCYIIGWGQTQSNSDVAYTAMLKEAKVPLISRQDCLTQTVYGDRVSRNMFCAGYMRGGIDTCQGDSGGPLLCHSEQDDRYYVWGVVSWGNGCAKPKSPGIYATVGNYLSWINRNMIDGTRDP